MYASLDILTATREAYQNFLDAGFSLAAIRPRVMAGATARLSVVCDLTNSTIRRKIGFSQSRLVTEDWRSIQAAGGESWTQLIACGCRSAGFEALIVPSRRHTKGQNIVIFPDRLRPGSRLVPLSAMDLPPHPEHWPI